MGPGPHLFQLGGDAEEDVLPAHAATSCTPTGMSSGVQCQGTETAGWPDWLNGMVNAEKGTVRTMPCAGLSLVPTR